MGSSQRAAFLRCPTDTDPLACCLPSLRVSLVALGQEREVNCVYSCGLPFRFVCLLGFRRERKFLFSFDASASPLVPF